jgi:hypothetical protein
MKVKVSEGRSVSVDGKVYLGGEEVTVPEEHQDEAETWLRLRRRGQAEAQVRATGR